MVHSPQAAHTHRATEAPVVGWQPIETAPRDLRIWAWGEGWHWGQGEIGYFHLDYNGHKDVVTRGGRCGPSFRVGSEGAPTHWMPLPPTPDAAHFSDCAVHNEPAMPSGKCDCYVQREDGEGFTVEPDKITRWACCDCGLVHNIAFVIEDGVIGVAAERNNLATAERRRARTKSHRP